MLNNGMLHIKQQTGFINTLKRWLYNARRGQYTQGDHGARAIILEAVVSQDLWFQCEYFSVNTLVMMRSNNDLNVLRKSLRFNDILLGKTHDFPFAVKGNQYKNGYYIANGKYINYSTFVKAYLYP